MIQEAEAQSRKFLRTFFATLVATVVLGSILIGWNWAFHDADHFSAVTQEGRPGWYRDLGGRTVNEIHDQELFYHDIGRSLDYARQADIIILGSSLGTFGFDGETLEQELTRRYGLTVYNMSFLGISSGEFSRRIIKKYSLRPRLWIIIADDGGGGGNFFRDSVLRSFGADVKVISATEETRATAFFNVVRRNLRWRAEDILAASHLAFLGGKPSAIPPFYRNTETGAADMSLFPRILATDNEGVSMPRSADCHAAPEAIDLARNYLPDLGSPVVLTLVPNLHGCRRQVEETASALGVEFALPPRDNYATWDHGGHLDRLGSIDMTRDFVAELAKTATFQQLLTPVKQAN